MARFEDAIGATLQHEGGFSNDPADPGGATMYGIEQRDMPDRVPISSISEQDAANYYHEHYWKPLYNEIVSQSVAAKIFDMGVNLGVGTAVKVLQVALGIAVDGVFGPGTLAAVNNAGDALLPLYKQQLIQHYNVIAQAKPQLNKFLAGWVNRVNS